MKRIISAVAIALTVSASLSACSSSNTIVPNSHVTIAEVGTIGTYNPDINFTTENKAASDLAMLTTKSFYEIDKNGDLVPNTKFGSVKVTKQSPFTVTYTFGEGATWSDGSALDATDIALAVLAAKTPAFSSIHAGTSLAEAQIVGNPKVGQKSLALKFPQVIADWKTALSISVPAHVVGKVAGLGGDVSAVRAGVIDAIKNDKTETINKLAAAYSEAFTPDAKATNFITDGAYTVKSVSKSKVVLKAVRGYTGIHSPIADTVNLNIYGTNAEAFKAISAGKADVLAPQASLTEPLTDLVTQSQAISSKIATVVAPGSNLSEQFVMNLGNGAFSDASYSDPKIAQTLRLAFINMVPKARAIDFASLTQTVTPSNSFVFAPGSKNYSATVSSNGSSNYLLQDIEKGSELIASLKLTYKPLVRVLFNANDPAAVAEWTLLSDHASAAGIRLANISSDDPSAGIAGGGYEVYLGPLPLFGAGTGSIQQLQNGPSRMPQEQFVNLTAGSDSSSKALAALDKKLFDLGYGLPMYQLPNLLVYNNRISGFGADPFGTNTTWGYWTWHVSADK